MSMNQNMTFFMELLEYLLVFSATANYGIVKIARFSSEVIL
jgi:hypothetical protein